ncbi:MAG: glycoside hydrolase family 127 protein, partial [Planctomycetaceae bacterium]|nr:glycoside hydrolase family 127 protein [Planctomycetaceae bacterium]
MKKIAALLFVCLSLPVVAQEIVVQPVHTPKISYFSLRDIQLLDGADKASDLKHIQDMTHKYLLTLDPNRLCSWFRREAGLTPKAQPYPGWESDHGYIIPGHILGFYLSSMAMMYETTGDTEIIKRLEYTLQQLDECQNAGGDGYIGAVINGRQAYEEVLTGDYKITGGGFAGKSEPTYIMNKITLGLYDVAAKCNLPLAKKILVRFTDWFGENIVDKLDEPALQKLLTCEHGSFSESYVDVYQLTGDKKYLEWAKRLNDHRILNPLSEGKDILPGWHANCTIQKNPGFESVYRYTGEKKYTDAARFFWKTVAADYSWIFGGNSTSEHFFPKTELDKRVQQNGGAEACNSVNMLRLTEALYEDYAEPEMLDFYERVLINHLLNAYEPEQGMVAYMTKVQPGGFKTHSTPYDSFWCCTGTGFESPAKFQKLIYAH